MRRVILVVMLATLAGCGGARDRARQASDAVSASVEAIKGRYAGQGYVCGDPALVGEAIGRVSDKGGCGIEDAVLLRAVDGVALSTPAKINCGTAKALKTWVNTAARPAVGKTGQRAN